MGKADQVRKVVEGKGQVGGAVTGEIEARGVGDGVPLVGDTINGEMHMGRCQLDRGYGDAWSGDGGGTTDECIGKMLDEETVDERDVGRKEDRRVRGGEDVQVMGNLTAVEVERGRKR